MSGAVDRATGKGRRERPVRQVILDTETTGLEAQQGHRIIEIGCVEVVDRRLTQRKLHHYINPERDIDEKASEVHGMKIEDLLDKPKFAEVADAIAEFCRGAEIIIHNAAFDIGFLEAEWQRLGHTERFTSQVDSVTDSLLMAREMFPGKRNNLDALCERLGVANQHRTVHGALLDAEILAEVYLAMTRGQGSFDIAAGADEGRAVGAVGIDGDWPPAGLVLRLPTPEETAAHAEWLAIASKKGTEFLWTRVAVEEAAQQPGQ